MSKFFDNLDLPTVGKLSVIAGPCVFETSEHAVRHAKTIKQICNRLNVNFIYKTSFDKANRTSASSFRTAGFDECYYGFNTVRELGIEILTDVHEPWHCDQIPADVLQIPAFLCRQTDLIKAALDSGKPVNIKKGQFISPSEADSLGGKVLRLGGSTAKYSITERGTTFGYNDLVVDMRTIKIMQSFGCPIVFDATHSVQKPGAAGNSSGGDRTMALPLAKAAAAIGISAVFVETHENPDIAPSDGANMIPLGQLETFLTEVLVIDKAVKNWKD